MKKINSILLVFMVLAFMFISLSNVSAQGQVTLSGSTYTAKVDGSVVYTGSRYFDAINAACNGAGNDATIDIYNSGSSGEDGGNVYAIKPLTGQTLDFHGVTVNCNSSGDLAVAVYADRRHGITVKNIKVTGNPRYGFWFLGTSNTTFTNITMDLSNDSPVGLGIRVEGRSNPSSNLTINGTINIKGSKGHCIETYTVGGVSIGDVTVSNTGGCGILLNDSWDCTVGTVNATNCCYGGGYAGFRTANSNENTYVKRVNATHCGRGYFSVTGSHDCTIDYVQITDCSDIGIWLQDATNTHVKGGNVWDNGNGCYSITGGSGNSVSVSCSAPSSTSGSYYQLKNRNTGMFLDGMGRTTDGSDAGQYANTTHVNSHWAMESAGDYYKLKNRGTGLYLDGMGHTTNGSACGQWSASSHYNQQWERISTDGYYQFKNRATGLYLDGMGLTSNGSICGLWANTTHVNSQWSLVSMKSAEGDAALSTNTNLIMYPNPSNGGKISIDIPETENAEIVNLVVYSFEGKKVFNKEYRGTTAIDLDLSLNKGLYLVSVKYGNKTISEKLIVN